MKYSESGTDHSLIVLKMHLRGKWAKGKEMKQKERIERNQSESRMITGRGPVRPTRCIRR